MDRFPPTTNPRIFTLTAVVVGYLLIDDFTANEQNAIGNWFMTVGQLMECNAAYQQTVEERFQGDTININSSQFKSGGSPYMNNKGIYPRDQKNNTKKKQNYCCEDDIESLKKAIDMIQKELDKFTNQKN